jgi:hypothetical protein
MALSRIWPSLALGAGIVLPAPAQEAVGPRIEQIRAETRGRDVFASFRLAGALNPELASKIESGIETAIRYDIRLYRHNPHWFWDDFLERRRYRVAATYDPVTREYVTVETMDGRPLTRSTTHDFAEVAGRLLSAENLLVFRVGEDKPRSNLYLEIRATFDSGYLFTIIPVDSRTPWKVSNRFDIRKGP